MRCFYHTDKEAIGTCKSCGKGLCLECAVDLGKGLACRGRCEADVQAVIQLIGQNVRHSGTVAHIIQQNRSVRYSTGIFLFVAGALFAAFGAADMERIPMIFYLGIVFLLVGAYWIILARRLAKDKPPK